ncbi:hypothetical protein, partial [Klebsiella quasipneumoniae]|uniref:hypothetical protein n=1 Tax=Klebsiella quasipneumoniae TaxID=1463165 RepID=UPI001D0F6429
MSNPRQCNGFGVKLNERESPSRPQCRRGAHRALGTVPVAPQAQHDAATRTEIVRRTGLTLSGS